MKDFLHARVNHSFGRTLASVRRPEPRTDRAKLRPAGPVPPQAAAAGRAISASAGSGGGSGVVPEASAGCDPVAAPVAGVGEAAGRLHVGTIACGAFCDLAGGSDLAQPERRFARDGDQERAWLVKNVRALALRCSALDACGTAGSRCRPQTSADELGDQEPEFSQATQDRHQLQAARKVAPRGESELRPRGHRPHEPRGGRCHTVLRVDQGREPPAPVADERVIDQVAAALLAQMG
jgi:hypothetical protein